MRKQNKTWISSAHQGFVDPNLHSNTLAAFCLAAQKGADMIETDARMTKDGVLICNHDDTVKGFDENGNAVAYVIADTEYAVIRKVRLLKERPLENFVPTLEEVLHAAYFWGICVNIDLKEKMKSAEAIARLVIKSGMRGRVVYATNGAGAEAIHLILSVDSQARFIDTKANYTKEKLQSVRDYGAKCFVYTNDFSAENIMEIRQSGCMLAAISLHENNAESAFQHHPDMAEYPHTSDFEAIDKRILETACSGIPYHTL